MLNKVSACSGVTSWSITRIYLGPTTLICHTLDICHTGGLWDALALFRRSRSGARKICVYARVCRVCIQSSKRRGVVYGWPGVVRARFAIESVFAEFDPRALSSSSSSPRIFKEGNGGTLQKCESLILLNNRSTMQRIRFYGIAVGASSNPNLVHIIVFRHMRSAWFNVLNASLC